MIKSKQKTSKQKEEEKKTLPPSYNLEQSIKLLLNFFRGRDRILYYLISLQKKNCFDIFTEKGNFCKLATHTHKSKTKGEKKKITGKKKF